MPLAERGYRIDCVEIEPKMAEILSLKATQFPNITVTVDSFEKWDNSQGRMYDLIYSAQAFHWIDAKTGFQKCHDLLCKDGKLALFWYFSVVESKNCFQTLNSIFQELNAGFACTSVDDSAAFFGREKDKLQSSRVFTNVSEYRFAGPLMEQEADLFIQRFNTTSGYAALDAQSKIWINKDLSAAIASHGGKVVSRLLYSLFIADRVD